MEIDEHFSTQDLINKIKESADPESTNIERVLNAYIVDTYNLEGYATHLAEWLYEVVHIMKQHRFKISE